MGLSGNIVGFETLSDTWAMGDLINSEKNSEDYLSFGSILGDLSNFYAPQIPAQVPWLFGSAGAVLHPQYGGAMTALHRFSHEDHDDEAMDTDG